MKNADLMWNVYYENMTSREIKPHNVFEHGAFMNDCKSIAKRYKNDRKKFEDEIERSLMYYYWGKCEWEIVLSSWPQRTMANEQKIDVFDQVKLNWEIFISYCWENRTKMAAYKAE